MKKNKFVNKAAALILGLAFILSFSLTAYAADMPSIDSERGGSISLTLTDEDGGAVLGGEVTLYMAASLYLSGGDAAYVFTDDFSGFDGELDVEDSRLAERLAAYVSENEISGTSADIGSDGRLSFTDLKLGLYLIVQTAASDDYETISPFAVTLPMNGDDGWIYDVDASPKVGAVIPVSTEEPATSATEPAPSDSGTEPASTAPPASAEPSASATKSAAVNSNVSPTVSSSGTTAKLPQTGQLIWPIPVLAVCGVMMFILGCILKRSDRRVKKDAV